MDWARIKVKKQEVIKTIQIFFIGMKLKYPQGESKTGAEFRDVYKTELREINDRLKVSIENSKGQ